MIFTAIMIIINTLLGYSIYSYTIESNFLLIYYPLITIKN